MAQPIRAVIFDLGGTLVDRADWDEDAPRRWALAYDDVQQHMPTLTLPPRAVFVTAMRAAEAEHWRRVNGELWSGPPDALVEDGFRRLGMPSDPQATLAVLDGYARAVDGWAVAFPDSRATLDQLRAMGLRLGLLSNTWWAAAWHDADLAAHGLADLLDSIIYTSDLDHSKPHPAVFRDAAARLDVEPETCVMVGDQKVADISGALGVGMRGVWKRNDRIWPNAEKVTPTATIDDLAELPALLAPWMKEGR